MFSCLIVLLLYYNKHFSDTNIEPLDPPAGSKPGDRVYAEGYDKLGGTQHTHKIFKFEVWNRDQNSKSMETSFEIKEVWNQIKIVLS